MRERYETRKRILSQASFPTYWRSTTRSFLLLRIFFLLNFQPRRKTTNKQTKSTFIALYYSKEKKQKTEAPPHSSSYPSTSPLHILLGVQPFFFFLRCYSIWSSSHCSSFLGLHERRSGPLQFLFPHLLVVFPCVVLLHDEDGIA